MSIAVQVRTPMPGLLSTVPKVPPSAAANRAVRDDLNRDLADPPGAGGSYFGLKIDYATWFDPKRSRARYPTAAVDGGLVLPWASAVRERELGDRPRVWGDLFAADLALSDPAAARRRLDAGVTREDSTSRAMVRYWVEALAVVGTPQPGVPAPVGSLAFGAASAPRVTRAPAAD
ncbi:MAG TPA: hypothetical protein VFW27_15465 [Actinoplanes sp.]|nr:hypothetical protein [Actinoplanes sp.]